MDRKKRKLGKDGKATAEAVSPGDSPTVDEIREAESNPLRHDELFRQGEELYALGRYQQAIHVWTRILFLERGDVRAKSAIERAKRAVSEQQRELDAELAAASEIFEDGDLDGAAARVRHVLTLDPRHAEGHQLSERIQARRRRSEGAPTSPTKSALDTLPPIFDDAGAPASKRGLLLRVSRTASPALRPGANASPLKMAGFVLAVILVFASGALYLHLNWESIVSDGAFVSGSALAPANAEPIEAPVPGAPELHYYNGARLYAAGHYRRALAELSLVGRDEVVSEKARSLILRIEARLLRSGELAESEPPVERAR